MADKIEHELAEGIEQDIGLKAMAEKFAPRTGDYPPPRPGEHGVITDTMRGSTPVPKPVIVSQGTIESKLLQIEKQIADVRGLLAQIRSIL